MLKSVLILGSGTAVPCRGRNSPGFAIEVEHEDGRAAVVLVDPSAGSIHRLTERGLSLERVEAVVCTHFHPDHVGDLAPILFAWKNPRFENRVPLPVFLGPRGLRDHYRLLRAAHGRAVDHGSRLEIHELEGARSDGSGGDSFARVGPLEMSAFRAEHTEESLALRFESRNGKVLAYSGDTDYCPEVVEAARDADLFLVECSFPEGRKVTGHLVPSEVGRIAAAAACRRVVMTHLYPECQGEDLIGPCRESYSGDVSVAEDGMTLSLEREGL